MSRVAGEPLPAAQTGPERMLEFLYPSSIYCVSCGNLIDNSRTYALCDSCIRDVNWVRDRACVRCGRPLAQGQDERCAVCEDALCGDTDHMFTRGYVCGEYGDVLKRMISNLKYNNQPFIARITARILMDKMTLEGLGQDRFDVITGVPMHRKRLKQRGYNQTELVGRALSGLAGIPYTDILERGRDTPPMRSLGLYERRINLEDAFQWKKGININRLGINCASTEGCNILLLDDVLTTGSTANACAKALLEGGAARVDLIVLAAGTGVKHEEAAKQVRI